MSAQHKPDIAFREMQRDELVLVETIHASAFESRTEARLPGEIIAEGRCALSVVAADSEYLLGHAIFSELSGADRALALGPVAIVPDRQGEGIGSRLIRYGLDLARERGWRSVFVLGDPDFYGRLGFEGRLAAKARVPWSGPNFQALELVPGALSGWNGELHYPAAFGGDDVI